MAMDGDAARIEGERGSIALLRALPVPFENAFDLGQRQVRFRVGRIELQRAGGGAPCIVERPARCEHLIVDRADLRAAERRVGAGELAIEIDRLLEERDRLPDALIRRLVPVIAAFQIRVVRARMGTAGGRNVSGDRQQLHRQRSDDFRGHLRLHLKAVAQPAFVGFGPQLGFAARLDQLHGDAGAVAVVPDAALDNVVRAQGVADVADPCRGALDQRGRGARDDAKSVGAQPPELRDHFLAQPFGEVFLRRIARKTRKRQHRETPLLILSGAAVAGARIGSARKVAEAGAFDRADEAIAAPRQRLDETRALRIVVQCGAKPFDRGIQSVLEVDKGAVRPELLAQLLAGDHEARLLKQALQDFERLALETDPDAVLAQLPCSRIELEASESECRVHSIRIVRRGGFVQSNPRLDWPAASAGKVTPPAPHPATGVRSIG